VNKSYVGEIRLCFDIACTIIVILKLINQETSQQTLACSIDICVRNLVSCSKGRTQIDGVRNERVEDNIRMYVIGLNHNSASCFVWVRNLVSHAKGRA
jgi:hypothetical protein